VVVEGNHVTSAGVAIELAGGSDVLVTGNHITLAETGILFSGADGTYQGNLTSGVTTPYSGGTDAGNNQ
jgi:hypothetical protein